MTGRLFITEYNNYGDPTPGVLLEPSLCVQEVPIGSTSKPLDTNTRVIALWSDLPCRVCFVAPGEEVREGDGTPMSEEYEITRMVHMGAGLRVAAFPLD